METDPSNTPIEVDQNAGLGWLALGTGALVAVAVAGTLTVPVNGQFDVPLLAPDNISIEYQLEGEEHSMTYPSETHFRIYENGEEMQNGGFTQFVRHNQVHPIAKRLWEKNKGNEVGYLADALTFLYQHVTYEKDHSSYYNPLLGFLFPEPDNFGKFPWQTLHDKTGDCDDYAIALASLTAWANIPTSFMYSFEHLALGVQIEDVTGEAEDHFVLTVDEIKKRTELIVKDTKYKGVVSFEWEDTIADLEEVILTESPVVMGRRPNVWISMPYSEPPSDCETPGVADFSWHYERIHLVKDGDSVRDASETNTFWDAFNDAKQSGEDVVLYSLPNTPKGYLVLEARPRVREGCSEGDFAPEYELVGTMPANFGLSSANRRDSIVITPRKWLYIEPQAGGLKVHQKVPRAVRRESLPSNLYREKK
jgi:hypothetical protein